MIDWRGNIRKEVFLLFCEDMLESGMILIRAGQKGEQKNWNGWEKSGRRIVIAGCRLVKD